MLKRALLICVNSLLILFLTACSRQVELKEEIIPIPEEEVVVETIPLEPDTLDLIRDNLQEEMRVFDVVEHHDIIFERVSLAITGSETDEEQNEIIGNIVADIMDDYLEGRIRESLSEYEPSYDESDVEWLKNHIATHELYQLITVYEREYLKHTKGKK